MSTFQRPDSTKIESKNQLIENLRRGFRTGEDRRIGLEIEQTAFDRQRRALPYGGGDGPTILAILEKLKGLYNGEYILEQGNVIGLTSDRGAVALEPGGQVEYNTPPFATLAEVAQACREFKAHLHQIADELDVQWLSLGFQPLLTKDEIHWMPKGRYRVMREYLAKRATRPHEMMLQTSALQASFDYENERDMGLKFAVCQGLTPLFVAAYANSPFKAGKDTGLHSYRIDVWQDTDPDRSGLIPKGMDPSFSFEDYVDFILKMPMMFLYRDDQWINMDGYSFQRFIDEGYQGMEATMGDWRLHSNGSFTDIRLQPWIEVRSPDLPPYPMIMSFPAFVKGLLYDEKALKETWELLGQPDCETAMKARREAAIRGGEGQYGNRKLQTLFREILQLSREGLKRQRTPGDLSYLESLNHFAETGETPAQRLRNFCQRDGELDISRVFEYHPANPICSK